MSMRNMMSNDDLANALAAHFAELHAKIEALPAGSVRTRALRFARIAHAGLNALQELAIDQGEIQPFSGGDPKPE
jgi:hypothetical protein